MWWEPSNERERVLTDDIRRLSAWKIESSFAKELGCFGVGSIWSPHDEALVPAILISRSNAGRMPWGMFKHFRNSVFLRSASREGAEGLPNTRLPLYVAALKEPKATSVTTSTAIQIAADRLIDVFVRVRNPILCERSGSTGTAGVMAWDRNSKTPVLLSAGHVFPYGSDSLVSQFHSSWPHYKWQRSNARRLGVVREYEVPSKSGWDVAVIRGSKFEWPDAPIITRSYTRFQSAEKVRVHGAYSGLVTRAVVQGALTDLGDWRNCWMIAPSGLLDDGDSGAAVFVDRDASLLGMYVAKSELPGTHLPLFHYVQDAFTLEQQILSHWNITFAVGV